MTRAILAGIVGIVVALGAAPASADAATWKWCGDFVREGMTYSTTGKGASCNTVRPVARKMARTPMDRPSFVVNGRRWSWADGNYDGGKLYARSGRARVGLKILWQAGTP